MNDEEIGLTAAETASNLTMEAQRGNQNHNYYAYAAIEIRKLRKEK